MNQLNGSLPYSITDDIPNKPKERQSWFIKKYGKIVSSHIANIMVFFSNFPTNDFPIVFYSITEDGIIHITYGKYHILFPREMVKNSNDWRKVFDVFVDGTNILLESRIDTAQAQVREVVPHSLSGLSQLFPSVVKSKITTSQGVHIANVIEIRRKI